MIHFTNDINFKYFNYNDKSYTTGTVVQLKQSYIDRHLYTYNEEIWPYAIFSHKVTNDKNNCYFFFANKGNEIYVPREYCGYFTIDVNDLDIAIEKIWKPIEVQLIPKVKRKDFESKEVIAGWVVYIIALLCSFILKQWYIIWFHGSIFFFLWRNKKLWE